MKLTQRSVLYKGYSIPDTKFVKNQVIAPPEFYARAVKRTQECFHRFQGLVDTPIPTEAIPTDQLLVFFSGSTTAGYVHPKRFGNRVFLNLTLMQENEDEFMRETIPHEVAHIFQMHINDRSPSHGTLWKRLMRQFGIKPQRCHSYDTTKSGRNTKTYLYMCACRPHRLSNLIHNRIVKGQKRSCKRCKRVLKIDSAEKK